MSLRFLAVVLVVTALCGSRGTSWGADRSDSFASMMLQEFPDDSVSLRDDLDWIQNLEFELPEPSYEGEWDEISQRWPRVFQAIHEGVNLNWLDRNGDTLLCASIRRGNHQLTRGLLLAGVDPNRKGKEQQTPLWLALGHRQYHVLQWLKTAGADVDLPVTPVGKGDFWDLFEHPNSKRLQTAIEKDLGLTPLMAAACQGDVEGVTTLLSLGASKNLYTKNWKRYPINYAALEGYPFIMQLLLGKKPHEANQRYFKVSLSKQEAYFYHNDELVAHSKVSTGRKGHETPTGEFVITNKYKSWTSTIYKVPMPWFMRLNCSEIGLHAGKVPGYPASAGCVRLPSQAANKFFGLAELGDRVIIEP